MSRFYELDFMTCVFHDSGFATSTLLAQTDHGFLHLAKLESEVVQLKEEINVKSEELDVRLRCYNEFQMATARNAERDLRYLL